VEKNVLCEKGDEITRIDGTSFLQIIFGFLYNVGTQEKWTYGNLSGKKNWYALKSEAHLAV
jgi:hypothetical protein